MTDALWQLGGWTMIHFLWLGTAVALLGAALRFVCRRAAPGVRYGVSLLTLAMLALLPLGIAVMLVSRFNALQPRALPGGGATVEHETTSTPGQRPGLQNAAPPVVIDLAHTAPLPQQILPLPSPRQGGVGGGVSSADGVATTLVATLPWLWLIGAPLTFALLASGLVGSERLRRKCTALTDGPAAAACEQLRQAMRVTRRVSVAVCDHLAQPVLIGILRPLILLPASALSGWTPAELEMVLLHELAHVRRWDNLVNLLQRIIESALFFHPAVWLVSRQVRRDREECCDAAVVSRIERPHDYAALLVSIAASRLRLSVQPSLVTASAMADHPLAGRIRRILKLEDEPMWVSRKTLGLTLAAPLMLIAAVIFSGAAADEGSPGSPNQGGEAARGDAVDDDKKSTPAPETSRGPATLVQESGPRVASDYADFFEPTKVKAHFTPSADNPIGTAVYDVEAITPHIAERPSDILEAIQKDPYGPQLDFKWKWVAEGKVIQITAPRDGLEVFGNFFAEMKKRAKTSADKVDPEIELPRLMHEIKRLEDQIAEANKELVNIEIFKQLALQNPRGSAAVEKAVAAALEKDPMIADYQQQLSKLQEAIQQRQARTRNPNDVQLKKLANELQQTEQKMQQHRAALEKSAREQIARMPNEAYRAAIVEHKIRHQAATTNLKKYQDELSEANRQLDELLQRKSADEGTNDPMYAIVYPVADLETIDFQRWMQLVSSDQRIDVRWFEKNKSLVVNAPKGGHEQISELLSETRDKSGDPGVEERIGDFTEEVPFDHALARRTTPPGVEDKSTKQSPGDRPLQPGDRVMIQVVGAFPEYPIHGVFSIEPTGTVALGATYGRVAIAGQTLVEAEAAVTKHLATILADVAVQVTLAATAEAPLADRPLQPNDSVMIQVVGAFPEQPIDNVYTIEPAGAVALGPIYGRVQIAGQSILEAQAGVEKHLETILSDAKVQLTLYEPASPKPQPPADAKAVYLYDGKPFDEWRNLWKHELNTERRTEAIEALAAFARAGYGKEAAETILDVASEYEFKTYDESPEGKLRERVTQVLALGRGSRVPAADWLPALMNRFAKDPDKWRPLMAMLISGGNPETDYTLDPATRQLLLEMASAPKYGPNAAVLTALFHRSPTGKGDPEVAPLIKAALTGEDVANALAVLRTLSFGSLEDFPEQLEFLFHQDAAARRTARTILRSSFHQSRKAVAERLIAMLDDPKRADDHADAIRALGVLLQAKRSAGGSFKGWPDVEAEERISKRFEQITREGPPDLMVPALAAMGVDVDAIDGAIKHGMTGESAEYKERIKQARDKIEAEVQQLVDPPNFGKGGGMGGAGGMGDGTF